MKNIFIALTVCMLLSGCVAATVAGGAVIYTATSE